MPPPSNHLCVLPPWVSGLLRIMGNGTYDRCICLLYVYAFESRRPDPSNWTKTVQGCSLAQHKQSALPRKGNYGHAGEQHSSHISLSLRINEAAVFHDSSFDRCELWKEALIHLVSLISFHYSEKE